MAVSTARVTPEVRSGTILVPYFVRQIERQLLGGQNGDSPKAAVRLEKEAA